MIECGIETAYYLSSAFVFTGSMALFAIDLRKYILSRSHSHRHQHKRKRYEVGNRPRTPRVASEPNTDGIIGVSGMVDAEVHMGIDGSEVLPDEEDEDICPPSCKVSFPETAIPVRRYLIFFLI